MTLSTIHQTCGQLFNIRLIITEYKLIITKAQFEENYASQIVPTLLLCSLNKDILFFRIVGDIPTINKLSNLSSSSHFMLILLVVDTAHSCHLSFPGTRSKQCTKLSSNISVLRVTLSVTRLEQRVKSTFI